MDPKVILVLGAVTTAWVMLSLLTSERKRKVMEWEATRPATKTPDEEAKAKK